MLLCVSLLLSVASAAPTDAPGTRWLVRLDAGVSTPPDALAGFDWDRLLPPQAGARNPARFEALGLGRTWVVHTDDIRPIAAHPAVTFVERDTIGFGDLVPDDPWLDTQWAQDNRGTFDAAIRGRDVRAFEAWDITVGAPDVVIAVLDSGGLYTEGDLRWWSNDDEVPGNGLDDDGNGYVDDIAGWDFIDDDATPDDEHGHGSHVAGTAAALGDNGLGHAGMCLDCTTMVVRNLDENNAGFLSVWAESLIYAVDNGAWVVNMSEGGFTYNQVLHDAVIYAHDAGVAVFAARGNSNTDWAHYPASHPETIAVGATTASDVRVDTWWWGSQYVGVDLVAPGYQITSLGRPAGTYGVWNGGTSMATPQVTGVAALMLDLDPTLSPEDLRQFLALGSVDQVGRADEDVVGFDPYHGAGRLDAARTLELVLDHATPPALRLDCAPPWEGGALDCAVAGATPGAMVRLVRGAEAGPGPCPAALAGECLDVTNATLVDRAPANARGRVSLSVPSLPGLGTGVALQAIEGPGRRSLVWEGVVQGCGDGRLQDGEACDDGDLDELDGCTSTCEATHLPYEDVAVMGPHSCALDAAGQVHCFGHDGDGATAAPSGPFEAVAASRTSTCALAGGLPTCWGLGEWGETSPVGGPYEHIEGGWFHYCAIDSAGAAGCWGDSGFGQAVPPVGVVIDIDPGYQHTCAVRDTGVPICWGNDVDGRVSGIPVGVLADDIAAGSSHSCLVEQGTGALHCWGWDGMGQASPPAGVFTAVDLGTYHSCALDDLGEARCWGQDLPQLLSPPAGPFDALRVGRYHACARRSDDGSWRCWGGNGEGQGNLSCGDGVRQQGEDCDDGARVAGDGCNEDCVAE